MKTLGKGLVSATLGLVAFGLLLFWPAGTLHYWQAWVFLAVFAFSTWIPSVYLMRTNTTLHRMAPIRRGRRTIVNMAFATAGELCSAVSHETMDALRSTTDTE